MGFGRVGGDGVGIGGAGRGIAPAFAESFYGPIQVVFSFPFLENESARAVVLVSRRLDPIQPVGRITISGLGGDVTSQLVPVEVIVCRGPDQKQGHVSMCKVKCSKRLMKS